MLKKILIGLGALILVVMVIGAFSNTSDDQSSTSTTEAASSDAAPAATTEKAAAAPKPKPKPKPVDTGRMSESEFTQFQRANQEVIDESLQFSDEIQACSVIGQTGDFVGFRSCVDDAYSGFDEDVSFAAFVADDAIDDTDKQCQAALRSYATVTRAYQATVALVYDVSNRLDFDAFEGAYGALIPATQKYSKFSTNALAACEPR